MKKMKRTISLIVLTALAATVMTSCAGDAEEVVIAGSTSVQPYIGAIAEDYNIEFNVKVNVQGGGSGAGITSAKSGTADIGMSSRALKDDEIEYFGEGTARDKIAPDSVREFYEWYHRGNDDWDGRIPNYTIIARDGLALITHKDNPIDGLTTEQVRGIYEGTITNWGQIYPGWEEKMRAGGMRTRGDQIHVFTREEGSGTRTVFEEEMMTLADKSVIPISSRAMVQSTNGTIKANVEGNPKAIGFISLGMIDSSIKGVKLNGVEPTVQNVNDGLYTFYRPFLFILNPERDHSKATLAFVEYILSERGQKDLYDDGLVPVRTWESEDEQ
jgi:phosphate transport system substrate-binding protein